MSKAKDFPQIVSFSPLFEGDLNFWAYTALEAILLEKISQAKVAIFPQVFPPELYFFCLNKGLKVFPSYEVRFKFPGKIGQHILFSSLSLPIPRTFCFSKVASLGMHPNNHQISWPKYPFIIKGNWGHEGREIFLIQEEKDIDHALRMIKSKEQQGRFGFLIQEFIPSPYDLRIVVFGKKMIPVWRKALKNFKSNLAQGGEVIPCPSKIIEEKALTLVRTFQKKTKINLAAIDFLLKEEKPLFNEINFVFGRQALGGSEEFYKLWQEAVEEFLASC